MTANQLSYAKCEDGASSVEYGLIVAAIAGLIVIVVFGLGGYTSGLFTNTCDKFNAQQVGGTTQTCR